MSFCGQYLKNKDYKFLGETDGFEKTGICFP